MILMAPDLLVQAPFRVKTFGEHEPVMDEVHARRAASGAPETSGERSLEVAVGLGVPSLSASLPR
jgi:hypothetical protein